MTNVMSLTKLEVLFPVEVAKAMEILEMVANNNNVPWYTAFENLGAMEMMEAAGINPEIIAAIGYEV